jgi:ribosome-associated protein
LTSNKALLDTIIKGIFEKKGKEVINIDFKRLNYSICDNFVICHGDSRTQVNAIADAIEEKVKKVLNIKAGHIEGKQNAQWVLIDFIYIVVHIFQKEFRDYYKLEELWGDADIIKIDDE